MNYDMKIKIILLFFILSTRGASPSGSLKKVPFDDLFSLNDNIFAVKIIKEFEAVIDELDKVNPAVSRKKVYQAVITEVISKSSRSSETKDRWHVSFPESEKKEAKERKIKKTDLSENDVIYIMDYQDINYSVIYYVEERHKIFYYYYCPEAAGSIESGRSYIFITDGQYSQNGVFYGNLKFGLYPDKQKIRQKINKVLKNLKNL